MWLCYSKDWSILNKQQALIGSFLLTQTRVLLFLNQPPFIGLMLSVEVIAKIVSIHLIAFLVTLISLLVTSHIWIQVIFVAKAAVLLNSYKIKLVIVAIILVKLVRCIRVTAHLVHLATIFWAVIVSLNVLILTLLPGRFARLVLITASVVILV